MRHSISTRRSTVRRKSSNRPFNGRRLTAETIKTIAKNTDKKIGPHGIRILRAIFCEKVDLVGLELPFSLVLDKSVFTEGIEIRNIKMRGDLSFDDSFDDIKQPAFIAGLGRS